MKKILLLLILISNFGFSQSFYSNYLDATSEWRIISSGYMRSAVYNTYYFDGFETINGLVYYKEYTKTVGYETDGSRPIKTYGPKYIREDSSGKFYIYDESNNTESVFFDNEIIKNTKTGDNFPFFPSTSQCQVTSTEAVFLGNQKLKKITTEFDVSISAIEGVGIINGNGSCYNFGGFGSGGAPKTVFYTHKNDTLAFNGQNKDTYHLFPKSERNNLSVNTNNFIDSFITYPNPTNGIFRIQSDLRQSLGAFEIYNLMGMKLRRQEITTMEEPIDISSFLDGMYMIIFFDSNNKAVNKTKLIKQ